MRRSSRSNKTPRKPTCIRPMILSPHNQLIIKEEFPSPLLKAPQEPTYEPTSQAYQDLQQKFPVDLFSKSFMAGKSSIVHRVVTQPGNMRVVIKCLIIQKPNDQNELVYRELEILQVLRHKLRLLESNVSDHFVSLLDWNKYWLDAKYWPIQPSESTLENNANKKYQCANLIFKDGGRPLSELVRGNYKISVELYRIILFQLLYSLCKAQEACEFVHNDLHLKNILIDFKHEEMNQFREYKNSKDNSPWFVDKSVHVTIIDFGLSRITRDDGSSIHNTNALTTQGYDRGRDVQNLAKEISKLHLLFPSQQELAKSHKRSLSSFMTKGVPPNQLLQHSFFDWFKVKRETDPTIIPAIYLTNRQTPPRKKVITPSKLGKVITMPSKENIKNEQTKRSKNVQHTQDAEGKPSTLTENKNQKAPKKEEAISEKKLEEKEVKKTTKPRTPFSQRKKQLSSRTALEPVPIAFSPVQKNKTKQSSKKGEKQISRKAESGKSELDACSKLLESLNLNDSESELLLSPSRNESMDSIIPLSEHDSVIPLSDDSEELLSLSETETETESELLDSEDEVIPINTPAKPPAREFESKGDSILLSDSEIELLSESEIELLSESEIELLSESEIELLSDSEISLESEQSSAIIPTGTSEEELLELETSGDL